MITVTLYEMVSLIDELQVIDIIDHETKSVIVRGRVSEILVPFTRLNDLVKGIYVDQISDKHNMVIEI